ncbi:hypothetical protein VNO77_24674 [Canavalia gladiata]|uniref:Uncharacterized protein n=1 Tax=Canavalia gladiata TaxID=3824 RepID=A0AAN9L7A2_CANGL
MTHLHSQKKHPIIEGNYPSNGKTSHGCVRGVFPVSGCTIAGWILSKVCHSSRHYQPHACNTSSLHIVGRVTMLGQFQDAQQWP